MGKMFTYQGKRMVTWNVQTGCEFRCSYCWARRMIETRLKDTPKYKDCGFKPTFHHEEMRRNFSKNDFVFVASMGDIAFCKNEDIEEILINCARNYPTKFLFCTKNPAIYQKMGVTDNVYLGATIETNRPYPSTISKSPQPSLRAAIMASLEYYNKFLSIEPIMDFDLYEFTKMVIDIQPKIVEIGCDNYNSHLPEPSAIKVKLLMDSLKANGIEVIQKEGLNRLLDLKS